MSDVAPKLHRQNKEAWIRLSQQEGCMVPPSVGLPGAVHVPVFAWEVYIQGIL